MEIRERAIRGVKWSVIDNLANAGITFIVGLVLARLLSPTEFGIIGIATIFINLFNTIVSGGLDIALIRKNEATEEDYNTTFYTNLVLSVLFVALTCLLSPIIGDFFEEPMLRTLLPAMSTILIFNGFSLIQNTILTKKIDFRTLAYISLSATTVSGGISIYLAFRGLGVWSLATQQILRQVIISFCLWLSGNWKPKFIFSNKSFKDLIGFSWKLLTANIINSLFRDVFLAVIGKAHSSSDLGQYTRADQFKNIISNNITQVVQRVSLPIMSEIQDENEKLRYTFRKIIIYSGIISISLGLLLIAIAKPLILALIGEKWLPAIKYLQIMSLYAIVAPITILNANMLNLLKRSDIYLRIEVVKKIFFCLVILSGIFFSIETMIWCAVAYYYIDYFMTSAYSQRLVGYGIKAQIKDLMPIMLICATISLLVWLLTLLGLNSWLTLFLQLFLAAALYWLTFKIFTIQEVSELKDIIIKETQKIFKK